MNNRYVLFAALAALCAGCSTTDAPKSAKADEEKVYVTGSRLPQAKAGHVNTTEDKNQIQDMMRPNIGVQPASRN